MITQHALVVGPTIINFISAQTNENWHLVKEVDKTTESGERWAQAMKRAYLFLAERTEVCSFTPARGERQICRVSGHPETFIVTAVDGEIDYELTKRLGFMIAKAVKTGVAVGAGELIPLERKPANVSAYTPDGQWYSLGEQFVFLRHEWRQVKVADLIALFDRVGDTYKPVVMADDQKAMIVGMIDELRRQERALGA